MEKINATLVFVVCVGLWALLCFTGDENQKPTGVELATSFFASVGFAGVALTLWLQREDLALQRQELALTRVEVSRQATAAQAQAELADKNVYLQRLNLCLDANLRLASKAQSDLDEANSMAPGDQTSRDIKKLRIEVATADRDRHQKEVGKLLDKLSKVDY